jgi:hypothetical protein
VQGSPLKLAPLGNPGSDDIPALSRPRGCLSTLRCAAREMLSINVNIPGVRPGIMGLCQSQDREKSDMFPIRILPVAGLGDAAKAVH